MQRKLERAVSVKRPVTREKKNLAISLFKQGETLRSIGKIIGVSGERVRQIMKENEIETGGIIIRVLLKSQELHLKKQEKIDSRENRIFRKYKITSELYEKLCNELGSPSNSKSPFFKWSRQKSNAKRRGISFDLSFSDWWKIWDESGKWYEMGRGGYVMGRYADSGAYTYSNVYICTSSQNASDQYLSGKARKVRQSIMRNKCKRGHDFDRFVVKNDKTIRSCTICQRIRSYKSYKKISLMKKQGK